MKRGIAVAGCAIIDMIKKIDAYPKRSGLTKIRQIDQALGGALCNVLIDLAKIDSTIALSGIGVLGEDDLANVILSEFSKYPNIDTSRIVKEGKTSFTDVMADERDKTRTFFTYPGSNSLLSNRHFDFIKLNSKILHIGYILLLDGLDQVDDEYGTVMVRVLSRAQESGIETSIDIVSEESKRYTSLVPPSLLYTDYCIINEIEGGKTTEIEARDRSGELIVDNIYSICKSLKNMGVCKWVIIHTPEASFGLDCKNDQYFIKGSLKLPLDFIKGTTGAGDAYLSGALYGAYNGYGLEKSMEIATAAAACSLSELGATEGMKEIKYLMELYREMPKVILK